LGGRTADESTSYLKMASVIHFKFRSALQYETVNFDGDHISLSDLKRAIAKRKGLLKAVDLDFAISNEQTGEGVVILLMYQSGVNAYPCVVPFCRGTCACALPQLRGLPHFLYRWARARNRIYV
jgi:hypothetical protein